MAAIDDWLDVLGDVVKVEPFTGMDGYGKATYGAQVSYQARVDFRTRMYRDQSGELRASSGQAWIGTTAAMTTRDRITLADGSQPPILDKSVIPDETGPLYTMVRFG